MEDIFNSVIKGLAVALGFATILLWSACITAVPVWLLWNWLMPDLFGLSAISILQAWGLTALSGALFHVTASTK